MILKCTQHIFKRNACYKAKNALFYRYVKYFEATIDYLA